MKFCLKIFTIAALLLQITAVEILADISPARGAVEISFTEENAAAYSSAFSEEKMHRSTYLAPKSILGSKASAESVKTTSFLKRSLNFALKVVKYTLGASVFTTLFFLLTPFIDTTGVTNNNLMDINTSSVQPVYQTNLNYYISQNQLISDANIDPLLVGYSNELKTLVPDYSGSMVLTKSMGRLTYDGVRVLGAYFLLLEQGKVENLPIDFYQYLNTHDALKIKIWRKNHAQRPDASIVNDAKIEELERIPGQSALYRTVERLAEGSQYTSRFKDITTFNNYVKSELGVEANEVFATFDNYFEIIWENSLKNRAGYESSNKEMVRDLMLLNNIYHFLHRMDYQDSYLLEGFTNARQFNEMRRWIGKVKDGSLGAFQGYDIGLATILSDNPELVKSLVNSDDKEVSDLAKRWQGMDRDEIYEDLKSGDFLYGAKSPVYFYWKISMIAQCQSAINYYEDILHITKDTELNDPNLQFTLTMILRKSKVRDISHYLRKEFIKDLLKSESGSWFRIPSTRTHMYLEVLEMLKENGRISAERDYLFYYQTPAKLSLQTTSFEQNQTKTAA